MKIYNVFSLYHGGKGLKLDNSNWNILDYMICAYNTSDGIYASSMYNSVMSRFFCLQNGGNGINFADDVRGSSLDFLKAEHNTNGLIMNGGYNNFLTKLDCRINTSHGAYITSSSNCSINGTFSSNNSAGIRVYLSNYITINNSLINDCGLQEGQIYVAGCNYVIIDGCQIENNLHGTGSGVTFENTTFSIIDSCVIKDNYYGVNIIHNGSVPIDCIVSNCVFNGSTHTIRNLGGIGTVFKGNSGVTISEEIDSKIMKNVSGGSLAKGDLVVFDPSSNGDEINTTTSQGNDFVFGVCSQDIADTIYGRFQTLGYFENMKVDGTTDIAVGDYLTTFTTAKIGSKAGSGDMAIAIALEAYTSDDSNGTINVLLITPRKI